MGSRISLHRSVAGLLAGVLTALGLVMFAAPAHACSCAGLDPALGREKVVAQTLEGSEAVFTGRMQRSSLITWNDPGSRTVRFEVSKVWKGPEQSILKVKTPGGGTAGCGYPFLPGEEYIVYADEGMMVSLCNPTGLLSESREDVGILGEAKWSRELPDSGGTVFGLSLRSLVLFGAGSSVVLVCLILIKERASEN